MSQFIKALHTDLLKYYNLKFRELGLRNPNFLFDGSRVSWNKYRPREEFTTYKEYYDWVLENFQYSLMLSDDSVVQIYYEVNQATDREKLDKASLAFLPNPLTVDIDGVNYIRLDCDMDSHIDYFHTAYHIHFGYRSQMRVSLFQFPTPSQFFNFIMNAAYNDFYSPQKTLKNCSILDLDSQGYKYQHYLNVT